MDDESRLKYELTEIEFDKRQLRLERRELAIKRQLDLLKRNVDLTEDRTSSPEDDVAGKSDTQHSDKDKARPTPRPSQEVDVIAPLVATEDETLGSDNTIVVESQQKTGSETCETGKETHRTTLGSREREEPRSNSEVIKRRLRTPEPEDQPLDIHKALLAAFHGRPPIKPSNVPAKRKETCLSDDMNASSESTAEISDTAGREKRRRMSQNAEKQPTDVSGTMTETQQYDLIRHYTGLLLERITTVESSLPQYSQKPTIVSRMRRTTNGTIHHTLSLLHEEFETTVDAYAKFTKLRHVLADELYKFDRSHRIWWPRCILLKTQKDRIAFIDTMFHEIETDMFRHEQYEDLEEASDNE